MFSHPVRMAAVAMAMAPIVLAVALSGCAPRDPSADLVLAPYLINTDLLSRSISFENPTGAPGEGGKSASHLGVGRKGAAFQEIAPGETVTLADIEGPGVIRHIWITSPPRPDNMRSLIIRIRWDDQDHPSVECPLGDFMGFAHGKPMPYHSAVHSVGRNAGMNIWLPMPFRQRAFMTVTNAGADQVKFFYQVDYTLGDRLPADVGRLHVLFRRENPTTLQEDFTILPTRQGKGRYIGAVLGIRHLSEGWWGEGEVKVYMDGDTDFPTLCGTGAEDYVGLSWGIQQTPFLYNGCSLDQNRFISMYRWHLPDPIAWREECRITIQQIEWGDEGMAETQDDWSTATFWYEPVPSAPLPPLPDQGVIVADIWSE